MHSATFRQLLQFSCLCFVALDLSFLPNAHAQEPDYSAELPRIAPLSVEDAKKSFELQPGFRIELIAAEPLVKSPVAFAFNSAGFLFVVEMRDYSEQATEHLGSIARLEDTNHDGLMDERTTFVEGLSWPTAIWPWKDGVLVAAPPQLVWFGDANGDGISDKQEVWYDGFGRSNVQGLVNSLRWTVDGHIQGATSSSGADLKHGPDAAQSQDVIALRGRDFVIDPIDQSLRPASGGGQHGMCFNRWGDKFVTSNSDHLQQIIDLDDWLSKHSAYVPIPSLRRSIAEDGPQAEVFRSSPVEPWRIVRTRLRVSGAVPGVVEGGGRAAGYFTGATGTWIMDREAGFGDPAYDTALVCDVGSNLVHRKRLLPQGLFWSGQRIDKESELLRSSDIWFRPVQLGDGPDGGLYIADMQREVIEHPKSLPPVIKRHLDLTSGRDRGRIWRVTPIDATVTTDSKATRLPAALSDAELVKLLHHPVAWQRRTASQLFVERGVSAVAPALEQSIRNGPTAEGRLLALHLLNRFGKLSHEVLVRSLSDSHPRLVAEAVRLIDSRERAAACADALGRLPMSDPHIQLALSMTAELLPPTAKTSLLRQLLPVAKEPLTRAAIIVSAGQDSPQLFASDENQSISADLLKLVLPAWNQMLRDSKAAASPEFRQSLTALLRKKLTTDAPARKVWLNALTQLPSRSQVEPLLALLDDNSQTSLTKYLQSSTEQAIKTVSEQVNAESAVDTLRWTRLLPQEDLNALAKTLITPTTVEPLQLAMAESVLWNNPEDGLQTLLPALPRMTPALKRQVLGLILGYSQSLSRVADAIERKEILTAEIAPDVRQQLFTVPNKQQAERFKKLLNTAAADRAQVIERYRPALNNVTTISAAQLSSGRATFQRVCAQCHRLQDIGNDVGPPLKQLADKTPDQLLDIILDPNREVDPKYLGYSLLLEDGRVLAGIIREESAGQIVLAETGGKQHTIARGDIDQLKTTGLSLMPIGLEEQITADQMAELIGFLKQAGTK